MKKLWVKAAGEVRTAAEYLCLSLLFLCFWVLHLFVRSKTVEKKAGAKCRRQVDICLSASGNEEAFGDICLYASQSGQKTDGRQSCSGAVDVTACRRQLVCIETDAILRMGIVFQAKEKNISAVRLLWEYTALKQAGADIVYLFLEDRTETRPVLLRLVHRASACGFSCVAALACGVRAEPGKRDFQLKPVRIFSAFRGEALVLHRYIMTGGKWRLQQEGYRLSGQGVQKPYMDFGDLRAWDDRITVGSVLEAAGAVLPPHLAHLRDFSVALICARAAEAAPGNLFFLRQPQESDGWRGSRRIFLQRMACKAWFRGCTLILAPCRLPPFIPHVIMDDVREAHIRAIRWYREQLPVRVIGVTGSTGKTSVKEMLFQVLNGSFSVQKSERNANVQAKIGVNLQRIPAGTEIFIQEIGGGSPGGALRHSRMTDPDIAVITNIGTAHIGNFSSREELFRNKLGILEGMSEGGLLIANGDDPFLGQEAFPVPAVRFGMENRNVEYFAENICLYSWGSVFDILHDGRRTSAKVCIPGKHNVYNALCSFAAGTLLGVSEEKILQGIASFRSSGSRQNLFTIGEYRIYADCYNASLESMEAALAVWDGAEIGDGQKKLAVIGQLTGMGKSRKIIERELASLLCRQTAGEILYYGETDRTLSALYEAAGIEVVKSRRKLQQWLEAHIRPGDFLLFKGSSKMNLDEVIDFCFGTDLADQRHLDEAAYAEWEQRGILYRFFSSYGSIVSCTGRKKRIQIPGRLFGQPLLKLGKRCFAGCLFLEQLHFGGHLLRIGEEAFRGCTALREVSGTRSVKVIGGGAFAGCCRLQNFDFGGHLLEIGPEAFAGCAGLQEIHLPASLRVVCKGAFAGCRNLKKVYLPAGNVRIEKGAFAGCVSLQEVWADPERIQMDQGVFSGCSRMDFVDIRKV